MNIALLYGGRSGEHEVSINSAKGVYPALTNLGHCVYLIAITLEGRWFWQKQREIATTLETTYPITVVPGEGLFCEGEPLSLDAAFAVTHGFGGEDGNLQGLCMLAKLPLCGCAVLSSAIGMHKDIASRLFALEGIPTVPSHPLDTQDIQWLEGGCGAPPSWISGKKVPGTIEDRWSEACLTLQQRLGPSLFIKPEDSGSSLGVSALRSPTGQTFKVAVREAKRHSPRVLVQTLIGPMDELECALLETGGGQLVVAGPALVVDPGKQSNHFLSYTYKYSQADSAYLQLPSSYPENVEQHIREYAKQAFRAIRGEGYARIDFFVSGNTIYLNEINTSPGMTSKSHFPLLMAHAGYPMEQVLQTLIDHALERKQEETLRTYRPPGE
ncbi:MAG: D-alanine--D-alanine ligase [Sphaerochaeta sp.]